MTTTRVSTATDGTQGNQPSSTANTGAATGSQVSADGRYVVFVSAGGNFVTGDTNGTTDVFLRDTLTNTTTRVSLANDGSQGNNASFNPTISADGTRVAFQSNATNLVTGDTNGAADVFVRDLTANTTTRVSVASDSSQANSGGLNAAISADGTHVVFVSSSSNLVAGDTNNAQDIFVRDLTASTTTRVSVAGDGSQANSSSTGPSISADGSRVAFASTATNLVTGDTNNANDVFVRDLTANTTTRVSVAGDGSQANGVSTTPSISADGTRVAFQSGATNLVAGDTNSATDIFVRDLTTNSNLLVSVSSAGAQANNTSQNSSISADGTRVAFQSTATNLATGDTNSASDIFVRDLTANSTVRVSVNSTGAQANNTSTNPSISGDGSRVAFTSTATNLVANDTNAFSDAFVADAVCFCTGTLIRTTHGDVAIEDLAVGDLAVTASGEHSAIRWIGSRTFDPRRSFRPQDVHPVRIRAHAIGENRPERDLLVSPGHSICLDILGEVLLPASSLVNGATIVQEEVDSVTYWHVELDSHDILIANGQPAESYLDMGNRAFFAHSSDGAAVVSLTATPDADPAQRTHADFCRPFHLDGPLVDVARAQLRRRAETLGWRVVTPVTDAEIWADVRLEVDGQIIQPKMRGLSACFVLPAEARDVWLVSPGSVPRHVGDSGETRLLGLCLSRLTLDDGLAEARTVGLDDPLLCVGFQAHEGDCRWTTGRARLPAALLAGLEGSVFLRVDLRGAPVPHWVGPKAALTNAQAPARSREVVASLAS